jgi:hypothetical protein
MSDLTPPPAFLKKNWSIPVRRRSAPNFFVQIFITVMLGVAIVAIGAASAFYWLFIRAGVT